jgi:hypothetical protein
MPSSPAKKFSAIEALLDFYGLTHSYDPTVFDGQPTYEQLCAIILEAETPNTKYFARSADRFTPSLFASALVDTDEHGRYTAYPLMPCFLGALWRGKRIMTNARQAFSVLALRRLLCCGLGGLALARALVTASEADAHITDGDDELRDALCAKAEQWFVYTIEQPRVHEQVPVEVLRKLMGPLASAPTRTTWASLLSAHRLLSVEMIEEIGRGPSSAMHTAIVATAIATNDAATILIIARMVEETTRSMYWLVFPKYADMDKVPPVTSAFLDTLLVAWTAAATNSDGTFYQLSAMSQFMTQIMSYPAVARGIASDRAMYNRIVGLHRDYVRIIIFAIMRTEEPAFIREYANEIVQCVCNRSICSVYNGNASRQSTAVGLALIARTIKSKPAVAREYDRWLTRDTTTPWSAPTLESIEPARAYVPELYVTAAIMHCETGEDVVAKIANLPNIREIVAQMQLQFARLTNAAAVRMFHVLMTFDCLWRQPLSALSRIYESSMLQDEVKRNITNVDVLPLMIHRTASSYRYGCEEDQFHHILRAELQRRDPQAQARRLIEIIRLLYNGNASCWLACQYIAPVPGRPPISRIVANALWPSDTTYGGLHLAQIDVIRAHLLDETPSNNETATTTKRTRS